MSGPGALRFLLTNDDGLNAPGLAALRAALPEGSHALVIAPSEERSACSHQVTTARGFRAFRVGERTVAVDAVPADCVRLALHDYPGSFDWVLAGINHGANLGADVYYSGTVAAVREAAIFGVPAIALSHYRDRELSDDDWNRASGWVRRLLPALLERPLSRGEYWNVNLPSLPPGPANPPIVECEVDTSPLQLSYAVDAGKYWYTGVYARRDRQPGRDVEACFAGSISVSMLRLP